MKIAREQNQQLAVGPVYLLAESDTPKSWKTAILTPKSGEKREKSTTTSP
jgi:hypothetical protein